MAAQKKLSERLVDVIRERHDIARTFPKWGEDSRAFRLGFQAGVRALSDKLEGLLHAVRAFERTDTVRMADESEMFDALQWNLAQYRTLKSILSCEGQAHFVEGCIIDALERVLAGEKMDKVTV